MKKILFFILLLLSCSASASDVAIKGVQFNLANGNWTVHVTLKHADTGWDHYADAWRVVDALGNVLGTRTLYHPHVNEQPFTRSLSGLKIPDDVNLVYIEAHDKGHGWSKDRVEVNLKEESGDRFQVRR